MRLKFKAAFLATFAHLRQRSRQQPAPTQDHWSHYEHPNVADEDRQQPAADALPTEWAAFQSFIGEIHRSEEEHQATERNIWATQLRTANRLNWITAIGAIVGAIGSLGIIVSLVIAKIAAEDAHMALVAANRAWIGPVGATLAAIPSAPQPADISVLIPLRNTGHEPATDASIIGGSDSITIDATYEEIHAKEQSFEDYCFSIPGAKHMASAVSIVVFPGSNAANDYKGSITIKSDLIDWDVVYGKKYVFLHACVVYETFGEIRHTSVCYYAQAGKTIGLLPLCDKGNRAD
jgi:hypothetical protein